MIKCGSLEKRGALREQRCIIATPVHLDRAKRCLRQCKGKKTLFLCTDLNEQLFIEISYTFAALIAVMLIFTTCQQTFSPLK